MRNFVLATLLLFALIFGILPTNFSHSSSHAQDGATPIFFLLSGDIYSYSTQSNNLTQLTTWGYNEAPILSPDGTQFVYNSWASQYVETLSGPDTFFFGSPPSNIWLWDVRTGDAVRIADQPANMVPPSTTDSGNGTIRSTPVWSPDGAQIAWTESVLPNYAYRLVTYNLATSDTRILVDALPLGFQDVGVFLHTPTWGSGGIALARWDAGESGFQQTLTVYNPFNGSIAYTDVVSVGGDSGAIEMFWLDDQVNALALAYGDHWEMLNVNTGQRSQLSGVGPYSRLAPTNTALLVTAGYSGSSAALQIPSGGGTPETAALVRLYSDIAVSPDGASIAFVSDALYVKLSGQITSRINGTTLDTTKAFSLSHGVIWGPVGWRVVSNGVASPITDACPQTARLSIGGRARVIAGQGGGNVLRDLPRTGQFSDELTTIPENGTMEVLAGPVCQETFNWWLVDYNGLRGWTAEGEGSTYWLEPTS